MSGGLAIGLELMGKAYDQHLQDKRENRSMANQRALMGVQLQNQKSLNIQGKELALQQWKDTNYSAQVEEMKKAGVNPGLLYGMSGGGGTTANAGSGGSAQGGNAPAPQQPKNMDIAGLMQLELLKAQKENIEASTDKTKAETINQPLQGENVKADTEVKIQNVNNAKAQEELTRIQTENASLEAQLKSGTLNSNIELVKKQNQEMDKKIENMGYLNQVDKATVQAKINLAKLENTQKAMQNGLLEAQRQNTIQLTKASKEQIDQKWTEIKQNWDKLSIEQRKNKIEQFKAEFKAMYPTMGEGIGRLFNDLTETLNQGAESGFNKKVDSTNENQW